LLITELTYIKKGDNLNQKMKSIALQNDVDNLERAYSFTIRTRASQAIMQLMQDNSLHIRKVAHSFGIKAQDLRLRLLLYLPRLVQDSIFPNKQTINTESHRVAEHMSSLVRPYLHWAEPPREPLRSPREAQFVKIPEEEARIIHERFHYLASFRRHSIHLGLRVPSDGRLVALITVSPCDLTQALEQLPEGVVGSQVMLLSRVFAFDWAPRNTISHLLRHAGNWLVRELPEIKMLITYVNSNLGFTGASYRASNWIFFGREWDTSYMYLDGFYITERELVRRFGTASISDLNHCLGSRLEYTTVELEPLLLFTYFLEKRLRMKYRTDFNHDFRKSQ
jgi:hypothetical protein